jgi:choline dehydrogenase-like flavoprotein
VELTAQAMFAAGAKRVILPFDGVPPARTLGEVKGVLAHPVRRRSMSRSMRLYSIHLMGTARMSKDPGRGVVDSFGEFHGRPGLFVADASLFPTPTGLNPMETIVALALRNARHLIEHRRRYAL